MNVEFELEPGDGSAPALRHAAAADIVHSATHFAE